MNGIQEVSGSIPLISTKNDRIYEVFRESCHFFIPFRSCPFRSIINVLLTQIRQERNKRIAAYESGELQKEAERIMREEIKGEGMWIEN